MSQRPRRSAPSNTGGGDHEDTDQAYSAQDRAATLLLLAKGREPSWSRLRAPLRQQQREPPPQTRPPTHTLQKILPRRDELRKVCKLVFCLWIISVALKILVFPAYHSTDFDVHRHWKAVTLHLPIAEWYNDDKYVKTRHTLDYPPAFALFEYCLALVLSCLARLVGGDIQEMTLTCLSLRDDVAVAQVPPSPACVALLRSTVILASDSVYWLGSLAVARAAIRDADKASPIYSTLLFLLLIGHPAILWLDNVHFQYNGMLIGILFISLSCLLHANNKSTTDYRHRSTLLRQHHWLHLTAAAMFTLLVSLKHLYVTNSLWYGTYLVRRYCCDFDPTAGIAAEKVQAKTPSQSSAKPTKSKRPSTSLMMWYLLLFMLRFLALAAVAVVVALIPLAVFAVAIERSHPVATATTTTFYGVAVNSELVAWTQQVLRRLFPFGRGLVHSYWAGNVWALIVAAHKAITWIAMRVTDTDEDGKMLWSLVLQSIQVITPTVTAVGMLLAQTPGLWLAWQAAAERSNAKLLQSFTLTSLGTFLFQYHAHEKAILTALLPATIWACHLLSAPPSPPEHEQNARQRLTLDGTCAWYMLWEFTSYSLLGIFPLLFQPQELLLKVTSTIAYLALWHALCPTIATPRAIAARWQRQCMLKVGIAALTVIQLEVLAPLGIFGRFEFLPLAVTSIMCAVAFVHTYVQLYRYNT
jgi:alpha-1,3-glucosyltransferase